MLELGVETVDAQHVFVAAKNAATLFLRVTKAFSGAVLPLESYVA
jgi:hypothetical protein